MKTDAQIKSILKKNWQNHWWGLMDCDRCAARAGSAPCDACPTWKYRIAEYRKGKLTKLTPAFPETEDYDAMAMKAIEGV